MIAFKKGDLVQRRPNQQDSGWGRILKREGYSPDSILVVQCVETDGDIVLEGLEKWGPWFWFYFDKVIITDLDEDDENVI